MNLSILIVDDETDIMKNIQRILEKKYGYTVYTANDGEEGLALYREHKPTLVVTDIDMPNMGGAELVKLLDAKDSDEPAPEKIYIISGYFKNESKLDYRVDRYFHKPFTLDKLVDAINEDFLNSNDGGLQAA